MRVKLCVIGLLSTLLLHAQPEITKMSAGKTADGIVYFLPKTVVRIQLLVEKKTYTPGEFAKYAEKYMSIKDVQQEQTVSYSVADVKMTTIGVRDTSKCYAVKMKGGHCETAEFSLSDDGVLLAINEQPVQPRPLSVFRPSRQPAAVDAKRFLTQDIIGAGSTAKKAELTAQLISDLMEQRQQLITGDADEQPQDEGQLRLMLKEIDQQQQALRSLFTGSIRRDTTVHVVEYNPKKEVQNDVLFRLSQHLGLVDSDDLSGAPFYITVKNLYPNRYTQVVEKKPEGFFTNVPGMARLTISREDLQIAQFDLPLAQFGFTELRDGSLFKRYKTHMQLHPATGAVVKLHADMESK